MIINWSGRYFHYYGETYTVQILISILLTAGLYFGLRKLVLKVNVNHLKIAIVFFPLVLENILALLIWKHLYYALVYPILLGGVFYLSFILFNKRYIATLTETSIQYETLLGLSGEIPLSAITKLEQKRNMLGVLSARFKFLDLAKKTSITFCDENLDEYEIDIFTKVFNNRKIFDTIIQRANECGNLKIRQYVI